MSIIDTTDPFALIAYAMATTPGHVAVLPIFHPSTPDHSLITKVGTKTKPLTAEMMALYAKAVASKVNGSGSAVVPTHIETGRMVCIIPADVARNLRGPIEQRDVVYMFIVRRDVYERASSSVILPADMATMPPPPRGRG